MFPKRLSILAFIAILILSAGTASGFAQQRATGSMEFVPIPPGEFIMGCSKEDSQCAEDEKPAHRVRIAKKIDMGKYLVTQAQWEAVMGSNPSFFKGADRPVDSISWPNVQDFLKKLNDKLDGYRYRLPTEAEWEYAERAGATGPYAGSLDEMAWYSKTSGGQTHPVGQKKPNAWGLYDMQGNVQEWILDASPTSYVTPASVSGAIEIDPVNSNPAAPHHALRGASWANDALFGRSSARNGTVTGDVGNFRGVRLVREPNP